MYKIILTSVAGVLGVSILLLWLGAAPVVKPLAEVDGEVITAEELEKAVGTSVAKLQEQIYNLKHEKIEALITEKLLAKEAAKRSISVSELLDKEVNSKVLLVTEKEIEVFYEANKARIRGELAQVRDQIRNYLQNQKLGVQRQVFIESLRSRAEVVIHLEPPPVFRAEVLLDGAPYKGPAKAPVTIVKFEDYHCPFCKQVQQTFNELQSRYGKKIRIVQKDFPIDSLHPQARQAAEAARCSGDQGKFWEYHDILYANAPKASQEDLQRYAKEVGLNLKTFEQCLKGGKFRAEVQKDIEEGSRLGVTGTPAFFVNGRVLSGAQPITAFTKMIDQELAQKR